MATFGFKSCCEDAVEKAELFGWLLAQMRPSYFINGKAVWNLPLNALSGHGAGTPLEAIQAAHAKYLEWKDLHGGDHPARDPEVPGEVRPMLPLGGSRDAACRVS